MSTVGHPLSVSKDAESRIRRLAPVFSTVIAGMLWWIGIRPFVSHMAADIGVSVPLVGQVLTLGALMIALAGLFTGPVSDHYGHRRSIIVGLLLLATSAMLMAAAPNLAVMAVGGLVGGLGMALTYGVAFAVVSTHFEGDARRQAVGMTQAVASIAVLAGPAALVGIAALTVWRGAFVVMALVILVAALAATKLLPVDPIPVGRCAAPRRILANYRPLLRAPRVRILYIVSMLRSFTIGGLAVYLGAFYFDIVGLSARDVAIAFMLDGTGMALGSLAGGGRLGSFNPRHTFSVGAVLIGLGALVIYAVQPGAFATVALATAISFVAGVTFTSLTSLLAQESPVAAATTMVLNISMIAAGAALGSAVGGLLIGVAGYPAIGLAAVITSVVAATLVYSAAGERSEPDGTAIGAAIRP